MKSIGDSISAAVDGAEAFVGIHSPLYASLLSEEELIRSCSES